MAHCNAVCFHKCRLGTMFMLWHKLSLGTSTSHGHQVSLGTSVAWAQGVAVLGTRLNFAMAQVSIWALSVAETTSVSWAQRIQMGDV